MPPFTLTAHPAGLPTFCGLQDAYEQAAARAEAQQQLEAAQRRVYELNVDLEDTEVGVSNS